jgi:hypothetical protein
MHSITELRETGSMEQFGKERIGEKEVRGTRKKPYSSPKLTKHGNVDEITEVLRLSYNKGETLSGDLV